MAGAAGALLAQTTGFASLDVLDFHRSADVLLMLVIGGVGWLYGGVAGAIVFKLLQDSLSAHHAAVLDVLARPVPGACWCWSGATGCSRPWTWFGARARGAGDRRSEASSLVLRHAAW